MLKEVVSTALIEHSPSELIADILADTHLAAAGYDPTQFRNVSYFSSRELPPETHGGLPTYEQDQLLAHLRDAGPDACFFTVIASS